MTRSEMRQRASEVIEELINLLDALDGDPDFEIETDLDLNPISLQSVGPRSGQAHSKPEGGMSDSTKLPDDNSLDLVWGAAAIGEVIKRTPRQAAHLLERSLLPARKVGGKWVASRQKLRDHFEHMLGAE